MSYTDQSLAIDSDGITIGNYRYPGHDRRIPFSSIAGFETITLGPLTGRFRLVGFGFTRPRHFFPWDRKRRTGQQAIALDLGKFVRPVISPEDHERVVQILNATSAGKISA